MDKKLKIGLLVLLGLFISFVILSQLVKYDREERIADASTDNDTKGVVGPNGLPMPKADKPVYKIFFENSGSMNGYVRGNTRIKNTIRDLVRSIEAYDLAEKVEMYWLNSIAEIRPGDLGAFIENLNREAFQSQSEGNLSETDMSQRLGIVLENIEKNNVGIMISDCLLLPRIGHGTTIKHLLPQNKTEVFHQFNSKLSNQGFNTLVLQLFSNFTGVYYDYKNPMYTSNNQYINNKDRPYYLLVFGKDQYLAEFISVKDQISYIQEDLNNSHYFFLLEDRDISYRVVPNPRTGSYSPCKDNPHNCIENARPETMGELNGVFQFPVAVDFSKLPLNESYYTDPDNYWVSDGYTLSITEIEHEQFTHRLNLRTENLQNQDVEVRLINQIPGWVNNYNLYDDTDILDPENIEKTFGLKYLFEGAHRGYLTHSQYSDYYFEISISVNQ